MVSTSTTHHKQERTYDHVEVTREQPVLEDAAVGDVDALALVRDDDDCPAEGNVATKVDVAGDRQMVELDDLGDLLEALLELRNLLEVVAELDDRRRLEHALGVDDELPMLKRVDVTLDEEQVRAALDGQEAATGDIDTVCVVKVLDGVTGGGLKLNDSLPVIGRLRVYDDVELHALTLHDPLERCRTNSVDAQPVHNDVLTSKVDPQVVRVEDLELANWRKHEVAYMHRRRLTHQT